MGMECTVGEIMERDIVFANANDDLISCAKQMAGKNVGCLIVKENDKVVGIITEKDLARRVLAMEIDAKNSPVSMIMSKDVIYITPDKDIKEAMELMAANEMRHLPVFLENNIVGIITSKDLIQVQPGLIEILVFKKNKKKFLKSPKKPKQDTGYSEDF